MFTFHTVVIPGTAATKCHISRDGRPVSFADVIELWTHDAPFVADFCATLAALPVAAFRWELPPLTTANLAAPFECVVVAADLSPHADPSAFSGHFASAIDGVAVFANLGGDAVLIVPTPLAAPPAYAHLAQFVRHAPADQRLALWKTVGLTLRQKLSPRPVWLNTAGAGVPWLHIRLDDRPKYYSFSPYRSPQQ